jgi:carbamoyl-phosphate synthase large subunit
MAGEKLASFNLKHKKLSHVAVKEAVFPFNRFPGVDALLGPEMRSTGEVMGLDTNYDMAFAKSQLGAGMRIPVSGTVFVSVKEADRPKVLPSIRKLAELGFVIKASGGNHAYLESKGVPSGRINKVLEGRPHVVDAIKNGDIALVLNTTETRSSESDSKSIRQTAVMQKVPYYTTLPGIISAVKAIAARKANTIEVRPLQDYFK